MKPRPTKIQPGATHWNPNGTPEWYTKDFFGTWVFFDVDEWVKSYAGSGTLSILIPVEELMQQPPEWNGEGLPPFGVDCEITTKTILGAVEYEGIGMFIAQTMDYYVMLMQNDRTPWFRGKDRVTFRPIKSDLPDLWLCAIKGGSRQGRGVMRYRKKPVEIEATQWFKNGDHPLDYASEQTGYQNGRLTNISADHRKAHNWEGEVVRYYRSPSLDGQTQCKHCGQIMHLHGWIDTLEGGHIVCPGDWIITGVKGEHYPCKPDIFAMTYEPVDAGKGGEE